LRISAGTAREMLMPLDPGAADRDTPSFRLCTAPAGARAQLLHAAILREASRPVVDDVLMEESVLPLAGLVVHGAYSATPRPEPLTRRSKDCVQAAQVWLVKHSHQRIRLADVAAAA